jgi:integrase/recombinase XerD
MFKFAAAEGMWQESKLNRLAPVQDYGPSDRRHYPSTTIILRRRHRLRPRRNNIRRDAPIAVVKEILAACRNV